MASSEVRNVLVVTLSNIGDVILTTPVITSLRSQFPNSKLTVVVGPKAAPLLEGSRLIDRLLVYDKGEGGSHKLKLVRALREEFYDTVVDLRNSAFPFLVRADRRSPVFRVHQAKPARSRHLEVLQWMKLSGPDSLTFDFFSKRDEGSLLEKLSAKGLTPSVPLVVVAPGAGSEAKRWQIEGFRDVIKGLVKDQDRRIVIVGDEKEAPLGWTLTLADPDRVVNFAGELRLRELAALVSQAKLVLTNDSAVMHLGHELNRPVVAIFGPTDPARYGREGKLWRIVRTPPSDSLPTLSSEKVLLACEELLNA